MTAPGRGESLRALVAERRVVICCGTGGVGKTTTAAALAVAAARDGRNVVVVTIDPAKRLANAIGLDHLTNSPTLIRREHWEGEAGAAPDGRLSALMLDTKSTFDHLIRRHAQTEDQAESILQNRVYRNIADALSGTQEYMATEKLFELHSEGGFDLIVVDTPPTRHALDFLEAPRRLARFLDNRLFRLLVVPTRTTLRVTSVAAEALLRTIARVVGHELVEDVIAFFRAFEGMEEGFRDRASEVAQLLDADSTAFVLVTTPRRDAVEEAAFFTARLAESGHRVDALVVNRVHQRFTDTPLDLLRDRGEMLTSLQQSSPDSVPGAAEAAARLAARYANLADFERVARREEHELAGLEERIGHAAVVHVPELGHDVHDFTTLRAVGRYLVGTS